MDVNNERAILKLISEDEWMMDILATAKSLNLPDWWVCAGFVRSKIWDTLHGYSTRTPLADIDVIYFDGENTDEADEKGFERELIRLNPNEPWSVKNEARMHLANNIPPYSSSYDAMSKFPETATALGVKLDLHNQLVIAAPHGVEDVLNIVVKPTSHFASTKESLAIYQKRMAKKTWESTWGSAQIQGVNGLSKLQGETETGMSEPGKQKLLLDMKSD